jgi:hypothetical protein
MSIAVSKLDHAAWQTRNIIFFTAILALNYTLARPSPVDLLFLLALGTSLFVLRQPVRVNFVIFFLLLLSFELAFFYASVPHLYEHVVDPAVPSRTSVLFELLAKTFVIVIAMTSAFVAMSWNERTYQTFMKVYLVSALVAALIGIFGFLAQIDLLTWDARAKSFIDDPNMFGTFLNPAILCGVYLFHHRLWNRSFLVGAMLVIALGILQSFSRAAIVSVLLCVIGYTVFINRFRLSRLIPIFVAIAIVGLLLGAVAYLSSTEFSQKFLQRLTFAESYDLGREGRYGRYLLVLPMILEHPAGLGVLQLEKIFPEPIHNIFLSSFINYGWVGGFTWLAIFLCSIAVAIDNYRRTRSPVAVFLLFAFLAVVMCNALHEGEHWRHLWLFMGLLWGFNRARFPRPEAAPQAAPAALRTYFAAGLPRAPAPVAPVG